MSEPTRQQLAAIAARGNALVSAGAGTGKTTAVVERCLQLVVEERRSVENILMVTFTEAAAAEMRERVRHELRRRAARAPAGSSESPRLAQELALLDTAPISTLHGFCLELVRQHFHVLGIDPQLTVLDEQQSGPLMHGVLDELFRRHYADAAPGSAAVRELVRTYGRGSDETIRWLVTKLHRHTQALAWPEKWFDQQIVAFSNPSPLAWRQAFVAGVGEWAALWREALGPIAARSANVKASQVALSTLAASPEFKQAADALEEIVAADNAEWERGTKTKLRKPIELFFEDARFLLEASRDNGEGMAQDWAWTREHSLALLELARRFTDEFTRAKRELGGIDFADQEQLALRLLYDDAGQLTPVAHSCRQRFDFVFVDECQDINAAQDAVLRAVSREGPDANRFLVGDVKQSVYRFRLADPRIFQSYEGHWKQHDAGGRFLPLSENFRSREALLCFTNSLFGALMRPAIGGLNYEADAELKFGDRAKRIALSLDATGAPAGQDAGAWPRPDEVAPRVELHLIAKADKSDTGEESETGDGSSTGSPDLPTDEREARLIALRLRQLRESGHRVWNRENGRFEPVEYRDMVVLMRGIAARAEVFAKSFHQTGVPLEAERAGFFDALEVMDLLNLLRLLDNPRQDVPLLAVLRSPLVGLSSDELVRVRLTDRRGLFWFALRRFHEAGCPVEPEAAGSWQRVDCFVRRLSTWREMLRHSSLSDCLETALMETHYEPLLLALERGSARVANVRRLVDLARRFDPYQRQGLFRFLRFIGQQEEAEVRHGPAPLAGDNAVRLMTIHQSKGLEFPVVVLAGLGNAFNFRNLGEDILLQEDIGLCPKVLPPGGRHRYPSVAHWLAAQRERRAQLGEELRLFYVAATRAKDTLILAGTVSKKTGGEPWTEPVPVSDLALVKAGCYLDWLRLWLSQATRAADWAGDREGANDLLRWKIYDPIDPLFTTDSVKTVESNGDELAMPSEAEIAMLRNRLSWKYPFGMAVEEPAKTSVTAIRRRLREETEDEARRLFQAPEFNFQARSRTATNKLSATEAGSAHHLFLQVVPLDGVDNLQKLKKEAERLRQTGALSDAEVAALDFEGLFEFWRSDLGRKIRSRDPRQIHRELPFTARMSRADLSEAGLATNAGLPDDEFMVVQGYVDLAVILPDEIWLVDFKTDQVGEGELRVKAEIHKPQLKLYALALNRIYRRPVTESWLHFLSPRKSVAV